jgi:hypothetical protein
VDFTHGSPCLILPAILEVPPTLESSTIYLHVSSSLRHLLILNPSEEKSLYINQPDLKNCEEKSL